MKKETEMSPMTITKKGKPTLMPRGVLLLALPMVVDVDDFELDFVVAGLTDALGAFIRMTFLRFANDLGRGSPTAFESLPEPELVVSELAPSSSNCLAFRLPARVLMM